MTAPLFCDMRFQKLFHGTNVHLPVVLRKGAEPSALGGSQGGRAPPLIQTTWQGFVVSTSTQNVQF